MTIDKFNSLPLDGKKNRNQHSNRMYLICVDNFSYHNDSNGNQLPYKSQLTIGKKYIGIVYPNANCSVINDDNILQTYSGSKFITIEEFRDRKISTILN